MHEDGVGVGLGHERRVDLIRRERRDALGPDGLRLAYHDKKTAVGSEMCTRFGREAMEVTDDVFESAQSVVFQEAENRMHTIKAVMAATLAEIEL